MEWLSKFNFFLRINMCAFDFPIILVVWQYLDIYLIDWFDWFKRDLLSNSWVPKHQIKNRHWFQLIAYTKKCMINVLISAKMYTIYATVCEFWLEFYCKMKTDRQTNSLTLGRDGTLVCHLPAMLLTQVGIKIHKDFPMWHLYHMFLYNK